MSQIRSCVLTILLVLSSNALYCQFNIKIGYNLGFPQLAVNDNILSAYQPAGSEVVQPFGAISFMHGIHLGARYRWGNFATELGWENMSRDRTSLAYQASTDSFTDRQYNYSFGGFTFGLDNYIGKYGFGSVVLYQKMKVDRLIGNNDLTLVNDRKFALRLQLIWQVQESRTVSLMVKPYYQFNLSGYNLSTLAEDAGVSGLNNLIESPKIFGITLIFYNGKQ